MTPSFVPAFPLFSPKVAHTPLRVRQSRETALSYSAAEPRVQAEMPTVMPPSREIMSPTGRASESLCVLRKGARDCERGNMMLQRLKEAGDLISENSGGLRLVEVVTCVRNYAAEPASTRCRCRSLESLEERGYLRFNVLRVRGVVAAEREEQRAVDGFKNLGEVLRFEIGREKVLATAQIDAIGLGREHKGEEASIGDADVGLECCSPSRRDESVEIIPALVVNRSDLALDDLGHARCFAIRDWSL